MGLGIIVNDPDIDDGNMDVIFEKNGKLVSIRINDNSNDFSMKATIMIDLLKEAIRKIELEQEHGCF